MADSLHARRAHLLLWEYAINDHAVSLEAAGRGADAGAMSADTMRFMLESWLRRMMALRPPPGLLLAYLWDKQPAIAFKPGNRALCRRMPVPASAFTAQRAVLERYRGHGGGLAALNVARYATIAASGGLCPLVADSYYHPSMAGHTLVAELLEAMLSRRM
eukprot:269019-Prymnesium_polylepis.1